MVPSDCLVHRVAHAMRMPDATTAMFAILMVTHNTRAVTQMATLRTLRNIASSDARLLVVDNASSDGTLDWLRVLAARGDIDLIANPRNVGHGSALEQAWRAAPSPIIVTLDSDAFPLCADWLLKMRERMSGQVKAVGIRHHRDYIHPACLMIARSTLEENQLSFLSEKHLPTQLDVAERISVELKRRGYEIVGLERTGARRRGSMSEPVYLGSNYEGIVYHQWYTTRLATSAGHAIDDVPAGAIEQSLQEVLDDYHAEPRGVVIIVGVRGAPNETARLENAFACLRALNVQSMPRWQYRLVVIEQDAEPRHEHVLGPLADRYVFAFNPGPYNRGWAFNIGACLPGCENAHLCFIDADLLPPPDFLERCDAALQAGSRAVVPYEEVVYLDEPSSKLAIDRRVADPFADISDTGRGDVFRGSHGGCIWVDAPLYREVGGHDERFRGWGREDVEFFARLNRAASIERMSGRLYHLYHPRPFMEDTWAKANEALCEQLLSSPLSIPRPIGSLSLYSGESAYPMSRTNPRDWENWHTWDPMRIESIVREERGRGQTESARRRLAKIVTSLGDTFLDLGCGPGALWPHLEPYRPRFSWVGADVTPEMLTVARRLFPRVPVYEMDAGNLRFEDGSFDVVLLRHVLEHLPPWLMEQAILEAIRVARKSVVLDFFAIPVQDGERRTRRVGENFLETRWTISDIEVPIIRAGWRSRKRVIGASDSDRDEVWILTPPQRPAIVARGRSRPFRKALRVSIVMATFHRGHTLPRTVRTIQEQTYRNWELIIINNAANGSCQFDDPRIRVYEHCERISASYARNRGLSYARGDIVCFFDDDDDMFPRYLERIVQAFDANPAARMVRCGMIVSDGTTNFSFATPECCLRREFATASWSDRDSGQDQLYFRQIVDANGWCEESGEIVLLREALCRANADPRGGLREGRL